MVGRTLMSLRTRRLFRDLSSDLFVIRQIDGHWQDEGFAPSGRPNAESGQRRGLFRQYEDAVDWSDLASVSRAVRVFEQMLRQVPAEGRSTYAEALAADGWAVTDTGRIMPRPSVAPALASLAALQDPTAIVDGFERISGLLPERPREAIGAAKELIESTAKVVLLTLGEPVDERTDDLPALVTRTQKALLLHPSSTTGGPDGSDAVKKILGGLSSVAIGVAELRNRGYGTGHGLSGRPIGLHYRHGELAVGAARVWCILVLDTLADPTAPWRKMRASDPDKAVTLDRRESNP